MDSNGHTLSKEINDKISLLLAKILDGPDDNEVDGSVGEWATKKFHDEVASIPKDPNETHFEASLLDWIHRFQVN